MKATVFILEERCKGCGICVAVCQTDVLELSEKINSLGYFLPQVVRPEACLNCALCEMCCPDFAIWASLDDEVTT